MGYYSILFVLILFLQVNPAFNQSFVLQNTGEKVSFDQLTIKNDFLRITRPDGNKSDISFGDVRGFYSQELTTFYYKKASPDDSDPGFLKRIVEGTINLYIQEASSLMYVPTSKYRNTTLLFLENGETYAKVFNSKAKRDERAVDLERLKNAVSDDPELIEFMESESYSHELDIIINIIRSYNLNNHEPLTDFDGLDLFPVTLYRAHKGEKNEPVNFTVSDMPYTLDKNESKRLKIPARQSVEICFGEGKEMICDLIRASDCFLKVYEVSYSHAYGFSVRPGDAQYINKNIPLR
jgi:hypothetical protein